MKLVWMNVDKFTKAVIKMVLHMPIDNIVEKYYC